MIGMILAEALFPGYSVSANAISDLGADCGSVCVINQPSAAIFDGTVFFLGLLAAVASYIVYSTGYKTTGILALVGSFGE